MNRMVLDVVIKMLPPSQLEAVLVELDTPWIEDNSPQAKTARSRAHKTLREHFQLVA
jgi:tRNA(Ile)-lysidine synthase TilS/MesJ